MKILVACEEIQRVTIELRKLGHEAYSCDILPCSSEHPEWHLQQDVVPLLEQDWDMIIAFPPCTHLAVSGAAWFAQKRKDGRQQQGIDFFMLFTKLKCPRVVIENPVGIMSTKYRKPDQIIHPWMFGDEANKPTCLWLKGVPKLVPTKIVGRGEFITTKNGKHRGAKWNWWLPPGPMRSIIRSKTFPGIAKAMASQWSELLK